jgi:ribosomal protein S27AE
MNDDEVICPNCGSLDVMDDLIHKRKLICNDCNHTFYINYLNK